MTPTRETFGNISHGSVVIFYCLTVLTMAVFVYGVWRRFRLWRQGVRFPVANCSPVTSGRSGKNCDRASTVAGGRPGSGARARARAGELGAWLDVCRLHGAPPGHDAAGNRPPGIGTFPSSALSSGSVLRPLRVHARSVWTVVSGRQAAVFLAADSEPASVGHRPRIGCALFLPGHRPNRLSGRRLAHRLAAP